MQHNMTREKLDELNTQLRILILQNVRVEEDYDDIFLQEINQIAQQILELKKSMGKEKINLNRMNTHYTRSYNLHY